MATGAEWMTALSALYGAVSGGKGRFPSEAESIRQAYQRKALREMPGAFAEGMKSIGIHPLAAMGAGGVEGTTVPMSMATTSDQANLTNMLYKLSEPQGIDAKIKRETLAALRRESEKAKWDYSLLIPTTHPGAPGKTFWGFNSKYQMYGSLAQALVIAANREEAFKLITQDLPESEEQQLKKLKKRLQSIPQGGDKQRAPTQTEYGTDIAP